MVWVWTTCWGAPVIISWTMLALQAVWDSRLHFEILLVSPGSKTLWESAGCIHSIDFRSLCVHCMGIRGAVYVEYKPLKAKSPRLDWGCTTFQSHKVEPGTGPLSSTVSSAINGDAHTYLRGAKSIWDDWPSGSSCNYLPYCKSDEGDLSLAWIPL